MNIFRGKLILLLGLWLSGAAVATAQPGDNPFDLIPRMDRPPAPAADTAADITGNPFDIVAPPPGARRPPQAAPAAESPRRTPVSQATAFSRLKLFVILSLLVLLAFLTTILRSLVNKSVRAFFNDTVMNQLYREQEGRGNLPFLILYLLFFFNAGVFLFFLIKNLEIAVPLRNLPLLFYCVLGTSILFLLKHLLLNFLAFVFPIDKEMSRYSFTIVIFGIVIGLVLVPANIFMAYASDELMPMVIYGSLGTIGLIYLFRYLRGLVIANNYLLFHKFHFLLYICTIEVAPVLFLAKLVLNHL